MVPEGVASIWSVDLPLERGIEWNDWLAQEIHRRIAELDECYLSIAFSHPHPDNFAIERFSKVTPFPLGEWEERLKKPTITFVWREDRFWDYSPLLKPMRLTRKLFNQLRKELGYPLLEVDIQTRKIVRLATKLKERFQNLDFAVAGLGNSGGLPDWILDLRYPKMDEFTERKLCERYAESHIVIGIHGSNMLLPSAHAGAVVELMPEDRWGNIVQDLLLRTSDQRETLFRYRFLPVTTPVETLYNVVQSILSDWTGMLLHMQRNWCDHGLVSHIYAWRNARFELQNRRKMSDEISHSQHRLP